MTVHQCPKCDLRFGIMPELQAHLVEDHGLDPESVETHLGVGAQGVHREIPDPVREVRQSHAGS